MILYAKSVIGSTHRLKNKPLQDYSDYKVSEEAKLLAIADGHGGDKYFRSHKGSEYAVKSFFKAFESTRLEKIPENDNLANIITKNWKVLIAQDLLLNPIKNQEIKEFSEDERIDIILNPFKVYGSTLLGGALINEKLLLFRIGDGDIIGVTKDYTIEEFLSNDKLGDETDSLSDKDVLRKAKVMIIDKPIEKFKFIMFSSDGYYNSFTNKNGFYKAGFDIYFMIKNQGFEVVRDNLEKWLAETSELGSGDDISLGFFYLEDENVKE